MFSEPSVFTSSLVWLTMGTAWGVVLIRQYLLEKTRRNLIISLLGVFFLILVVVNIFLLAYRKDTLWFIPLPIVVGCVAATYKFSKIPSAQKNRLIGLAVALTLVFASSFVAGYLGS